MKSTFSKFHINEINVCEISPQWNHMKSHFSKTHLGEITNWENPPQWNQRLRESTSTKSTFAKIHINEINVCENPPQWNLRFRKSTSMKSTFAKISVEKSGSKTPVENRVLQQNWLTHSNYDRSPLRWLFLVKSQVVTRSFAKFQRVTYRRASANLPPGGKLPPAPGARVGQNSFALAVETRLLGAVWFIRIKLFKFT